MCAPTHQCRRLCLIHSGVNYRYVPPITRLCVPRLELQSNRMKLVRAKLGPTISIKIANPFVTRTLGVFRFADGDSKYRTPIKLLWLGIPSATIYYIFNPTNTLFSVKQCSLGALPPRSFTFLQFPALLNILLPKRAVFSS